VGEQGQLWILVNLLENTDSHIGLAAANIFQFTENSYQNIKKRSQATELLIYGNQDYYEMV
jgi:hypothetical protein